MMLPFLQQHPDGINRSSFATLLPNLPSYSKDVGNTANMAGRVGEWLMAGREPGSLGSLGKILPWRWFVPYQWIPPAAGGTWGDTLCGGCAQALELHFPAPRPERPAWQPPSGPVVVMCTLCHPELRLNDGPVLANPPAPE